MIRTDHLMSRRTDPSRWLIHLAKAPSYFARYDKQTDSPLGDVVWSPRLPEFLQVSLPYFLGDQTVRFPRFFTNKPQNTSFSSRTYLGSSRAAKSLSSSASRLKALSISVC